MSSEKFNRVFYEETIYGTLVAEIIQLWLINPWTLKTCPAKKERGSSGVPIDSPLLRTQYTIADVFLKGYSRALSLKKTGGTFRA